MRYFFDFRHGACLMDDRVGVTVASPEILWREALNAARDVGAQLLGQGLAIDDKTKLEIRDENGKVTMTVSLDAVLLAVTDVLALNWMDDNAVDPRQPFH